MLPGDLQRTGGLLDEMNKGWIHDDGLVSHRNGGSLTQPSRTLVGRRAGGVGASGSFDNQRHIWLNLIARRLRTSETDLFAHSKIRNHREIRPGF